MTASEKKMLKVLAVILLIMAVVWGRRYMSKKPSRVRGKQRQAATTSKRTSTRSKGRSTAAKKKKKKQVLTPRDIPRLNDNLRLKLKQMKNPDVKAIDDEDILYGTKNIWLPIDLNDRQVEKIKRDQKAKAMGTEMMADTLFFRGVAHVNGERLAIIERSDRTIPWYVKEGEMLEDTEFVVTNIAENNSQVTILDKKARREGDKYKTIPWSGIQNVDELSTEEPKNIKTKKPVGDVEEPDAFAPGEDDLEIIE